MHRNAEFMTTGHSGVSYLRTPYDLLWHANYMINTGACVHAKTCSSWKHENKKRYRTHWLGQTQVAKTVCSTKRPGDIARKPLKQENWHSNHMMCSCHLSLHAASITGVISSLFIKENEKLLFKYQISPQPLIIHK